MRKPLILVLLALASLSPARAGDITVSKPYVLAADTPSRTIFYISCEQAPHLGGACFTVPSGAATVALKIDDATTTHPGAQVRFLDAGGGRLKTTDICGATPQAVPPGTNRIQVLVNGPSTATATCASVGTAGTITATFTTEAGPSEGDYVPSPPIYGVKAERKHYVPSGGTTIQADVYRPDAPGRFPVLVWFDVYYKDDPGAVVNSERDFFVSRGFVFVHASSPGSNTSGGL